MKKVLFLDIDGVLNSESYAERRGERPADLDAENAWHIDPAAVLKLNHLISVTEASVVLSSDWRLAPAKPGLLRTDAALQTQGATFRLIDSIPKLTEDQRLKRFGLAWRGNYTPRGLEIQSWLDAHPGVNRFAIVDDEPDMEHLSDFLVLTNPAIGLTDADCAALERLLERHS